VCPDTSSYHAGHVRPGQHMLCASLHLFIPRRPCPPWSTYAVCFFAPLHTTQAMSALVNICCVRLRTSFIPRRPCPPWSTYAVCVLAPLHTTQAMSAQTTSNRVPGGLGAPASAPAPPQPNPSIAAPSSATPLPSQQQQPLATSSPAGAAAAFGGGGMPGGLVLKLARCVPVQSENCTCASVCGRGLWSKWCARWRLMY